MSERPPPSLEILLVEDSPSDAFLTTEALKESKRSIQVHTVQDGVEALAFLRREPPHTNAPRPDLILLDLNLPRKDGREVLAEIKADSRLGCIPVIVLTSSGAEQDIAHAYRLHANCYLLKPADFSNFKNIVRLLDEFWLRVVRLPPRD